MVSCFLQPSQQHDLDERPHMEAVGSGVEADVGGNAFFAEKRIESLPVVAIFEEAALGEDVQQV